MMNISKGKIIKYTVFYGALTFIFSFLGNFLGTYADTIAERMSLTSAEGNLMMMERYNSSLHVLPNICYAFAVIFFITLLFRVGFYLYINFKKDKQK